MRIRNMIPYILSAVLPAVAQIPTNRAVVLEGVPYEQPMWSREDPFGFTTLSNAALTASAAASTAAVGVVLSPRVTALEALTNDISAAYFLATTNAAQVAALRASSPLWDAAYYLALTNANKIAILNGSTAQWDAAFALATTNSSRLGVLEGLQAYWTAAYNLSITNNARLNAIDILSPSWTAAYYLSQTNANAITLLQNSVAALPTTAYTDSQDGLDRAYALALFNAVANTNSGNILRVLDQYNPSTSWLEYGSNTVWLAEVVTTVAESTNYQWYAHVSIPLSVSSDSQYNATYNPATGAYLAATTTNVIEGATAAKLCDDAGFYPITGAANGTSVFGFAANGTRFMPAFLVDSTYYTTPGAYNSAPGGLPYLLSAQDLVTYHPTDGVPPLSQPDTAASPVSFTTFDIHSAEGTAGVYYIAGFSSGITIYATRQDTIIPPTVATNRTELLAFTNGIWAAIAANSNAIVVANARIDTNATAIATKITAPTATNIAQAVVAPYTNGATLGLTALQSEVDTLATVASRGSFAGTETISPLNISIGGDLSGAGRRVFGTGLNVTNIDVTASGANQSGYNSGLMTIGADAYGASQSGRNTGTQTIWANANGASQIGQNFLGTQTIGAWASGASQRGANYGGSMIIGDYAFGASQSGENRGTTMTIGGDAGGASQSGYNSGTMTIGVLAYGASQSGRVGSSATATNDAVGAMQLFDLTVGQDAQTTVGGSASILLGAGVASNKNAIVAGDGQVSHGDGSITAGGGFYGNLTGNATTATTVTGAQSNTIATAWQNPAASTNWLWTSDGVSITLTNYNFATGGTDVVIPDTLDGLPVTSFGDFFSPGGLGSFATVVSSISGGNNITSVVGAAFLNCLSLASVSLPKATAIDYFAFNGCTNLSSVTLPLVTTIGSDAFGNCTALASISLPKVTAIAGSVFYGCTALTSVTFDQNAPTVGAGVYTDAPGVTNYVTNPTATGWGATFGGMPVVRMDLTGRLNTMAINNGFETQDGQTLTFDPATRIMTVTPASGSFKVTAGGTTHTFSAPANSSPAPLSDDLYYYFNTAGQFIGTNVAWTINGEAQVGYVKLFTNDSSVVFTIDERHGVNISDEWHRQQHFTVGTKWSSGLSLFHNASDTATAVSSTGIGTCISIADGIIYDEDVKHQTVTNGVQSNAGIATNTAGVFPIQSRIESERRFGSATIFGGFK